MIRLYAIFSSNYPVIHGLVLLALVGFFGVSVYQLLVNQVLIFFVGLVVLLLPIFFFARVADYKRKYLHD